ncbi:hypothetical protein HPB47_003757, partial [Ixodes persulcatus]
EQRCTENSLPGLRWKADRWLSGIRISQTSSAPTQTASRCTSRLQSRALEPTGQTGRKAVAIVLGSGVVKIFTITIFSPRLLHFSLTSVLVRFDVTRHLRLADLANALAYRRSKAKEVQLRVALGHSWVEGEPLLADIRELKLSLLNIPDTPTHIGRSSRQQDTCPNLYLCSLPSTLEMTVQSTISTVITPLHELARPPSARPTPTVHLALTPSPSDNFGTSLRYSWKPYLTRSTR